MGNEKLVRLWSVFSIALLVACGHAGGVGEEIGDSEDFYRLDLSDFADRGNYHTGTTDVGLSNSGYVRARLHYPIGEGPFPGIVVCPGLFAVIELNDRIYGEHLASWGFIVLLVEGFGPNLNSSITAEALKAGVEELKEHNNKPDSQIYKKLNELKIGITGQSMGGGGALKAANDLGDQIQAVVPTVSFIESYYLSNVKAPTCLIAGSYDIIASPLMSNIAFNLIQDSTQKALRVIAGMDHAFWGLGLDDNLDKVQTLTTAWFLYYLQDNENARATIYGDNVEMSWFSQYINNLTANDETIMIGDSIFALSGGIARSLERLSGESYRHYYLSGAQMSDGLIPSIPMQYRFAKWHNCNVDTVIMDGGGNDVLFSMASWCPAGILTTTCKKHIDNTVDDFRQLLDQMRQDGVKDVVVLGYYEIWGREDIFDYAIPKLQSMVLDANHGGMNCYFVDPKDEFRGRPGLILFDGIHPTTAGSEILADLIWDVMEENNIEQ